MLNISIFKLNCPNYQKSQKLQPSAQAFDEMKPMIFEFEINKNKQCKPVPLIFLAVLALPFQCGHEPVVRIFSV